MCAVVRRSCALEALSNCSWFSFRLPHYSSERLQSLSAFSFLGLKRSLIVDIGDMAVEWPAQAGDRRSSIATSRLDRRSRVAASCVLPPSADRKRRQSRQSAHSVPLR
jgi:hypothetical protein